MALVGLAMGGRCWMGPQRLLGWCFLQLVFIFQNCGFVHFHVSAHRSCMFLINMIYRMATSVFPSIFLTFIPTHTMTLSFTHSPLCLLPLPLPIHYAYSILFSSLSLFSLLSNPVYPTRGSLQPPHLTTIFFLFLKKILSFMHWLDKTVFKYRL